MKRISILFCAALFALSMSAKGREVVTFHVDLHCQGCIDKIMHNIAYEKGVKDLQCDLDSKTVVVTFDPDKTNIETLQAAFAKIKKPATVVNQEAGVKSQEPVDAESGASTRR